MIQIKSPTRVDLAGGTLDCWPLFLFAGEASTVNLSIDVMTSVELDPRSDQKVSVNITDLGWSSEFENIDALIADDSAENLLLREVLRYHKPTKGFDIKTASQSPVGGGLGGSSSLCISILKAICELESWNWDAYEYVERAHNVEARILHGPTGTQDYVPAIIGGLNHLHYGTNGIQIRQLPMDADYFSEKISLVYTGKPHHSGINNWQVIKKAVEKDAQTLVALKKIAKISEELTEVCESQEWDKLPHLLNIESETRVMLSKGFSSPEIESLRTEAMGLGADAVKICGAGGGGCVLIWGESKLHDKISSLCEKSALQHLRVKAVPALKNAPAHKS